MAMNIAESMSQESVILTRMINQSSQLMNIQNYIKKLEERGHLITIYQDFERAFEIEKETNKIEAMIKSNKHTWKDYFHWFKINFEAIWQTMLNDIFNNMMYQEEMKLNKLKMNQHSKAEITPKNNQTRNKTYINDSQTFEKHSYRDSDKIRYYNRPEGAWARNSQQQSFDKAPSSIFEMKRFSNKENIIDQLKKKHKFGNKKQSSTKRQSDSKHNFYNRGNSRSDKSSPLYSKSRSCNRSHSGSATSRSHIQRDSKMGRFSQLERFPDEPPRSPGPCYYNPNHAFIIPSNSKKHKNGVMEFWEELNLSRYDNVDKQRFHKVHKKFN